MSSCLALGSNPPVTEVLYCAIKMAAGSEIIAAILIFVLLLYGMYKFRIPIVAQLAIFVFAVFVFAGAGVSSLSFAPFFTELMLLVLVFIGFGLVLLFWGLRR